MTEYIVDLADNPSFGGVLVTCGEIVRCRDCKYYDKHLKFFEPYCEKLEDSYIFVTPDDYCAWGERKVDA